MGRAFRPGPASGLISKATYLAGPASDAGMVGSGQRTYLHERVTR